MKKLLAFLALVSMPFFGYIEAVQATAPIMHFQAHPFFHIHRSLTTVPTGLSPASIRSIYNLPSAGGTGTIAIIDAYANKNLVSDLNTFDSSYGLPTCTTTNGCLSIHPMSSRVQANSSWGLEEALDVQWAHAIAPSARILLVEARSASGNDLLSAVDFARKQSGVTAVSMSWGGSEFASESNYDQYFTSQNGQHISFFASAGDNGAEVSWPAVSANVTGVGGTTLQFTNGTFSGEIAWNGSGGGLSAYEQEPGYQTSFNVPGANGFRAVPDVAYDADPSTGVSVYDSYGYNGWLTIGGTSVGSPQWAAIKSLGTNFFNSMIYQNTSDFRDVTSGTNGTCGFYCSAGTGYDYITGLGSPIAYTY